MKRIINILLCLAIAISSCSMVIFADETAEATEETVVLAPKEAEIVEFLEIIKEGKDADFWAKGVTRGEFAQYVYNIVKSMDMVEKNSYYNDVERGSKLDIALNYLVKTDVLSVGESRLFRPDDYITYSEAYKMLVVIAAYEPYAKANGGYPIGYLDAARVFNISDGVSHADFVDNTSAAKMIYNTLFTNMYDLKSVTIIGNQYTDEYTETVLERYFDIYRVDGVVTKKNRVDLNSTTRVLEGKMEINGVVYDDFVEDQDLLGYRVKALVKDNEIGNDSVLYAEISEKNVVVEIAADDLRNVTIDSITYTQENGKNKTINLKNAAFVKNGELLGSDIPKKAKIENGNVVVISTNEGETFDKVIITEYEIFVVGLIDAAYKRIFDKYDPAKKVLKLDDEELESVSILLNGNPANFMHIKQDDVLSVMRTSDEEIVTAIISNEKVTGTIESITGDGKEYLTVNGVEYTLNSLLAKRRTASLGDRVTLVFDATGKVAEILNAESETYKVGYVHALGPINKGFNSTYGMKIYSLDGENKLYNLEKKIYINAANTRTECANIVPLLGTEEDVNVLRPQLIRFAVNSDGNIYSVVTANYSDDMRDSRYLNRTLEENKHKFYRSLVIPKTPLNSETVVLQVPDNATISGNVDYEKYFRIKTTSNMSTNRSYYLEAYKTNEDTPYTDVLIHKVNAGESLDAYSNYAMVRRTYIALDGEENEIYGLELFEKGKGVQYITNLTCDWPADGVLEGDVIKFSVDSTNCIGAIQVIYRPSEPDAFETIAPMKDSDYSAQGRLTGHFVVDKFEGEEMDSGGVQSLLSMSDTFGGDIAFCQYYSRLKPVMVYDIKARDGDRARLGTIKDVISYNGSGGLASSYVIIHANLGEVQSVFVINNN